jgi:two-component system nitrogen regulation sensor histidine kinase NtrY
VVGVFRLADGRTVVEVVDDGRGLPAQEREKLTEPYVTTRTKGSGLGLAIVKRVMDDHGGELSLDDRADSAETGAVVRLIFPATAALSEPGSTREETLIHGA